MCLPICAHARPFPCTITNNMGWKVCFLKSTICWSLGRRKIVLCAGSIIICHDWELMSRMARSIDILFAECDYNHMHTHTQTHTWVCSHTINVVRKEQRKIWRTRALFSREQGMPTCQSFSQEGLLLPVFKTRRKWKHSEGFWGRNVVTWNAGCLCPWTAFPQWYKTPGFLLFLSCWESIHS